MLAALFVLVQVPIRVPNFAAGVSPEFQQSALKVESKLSDGDISGAKEAMKFLPKETVRVRYDDSKVPSARKESVRAAVEEGLACWTQAHVRIQHEFVESAPDVLIDFQDKLPAASGEAAPAKSAVFFNDPGAPARVEIVAALTDGKRALSEQEIRNEIAFGMGRYLGLAPSIIPNTIMGQSSTVQWKLPPSAIEGAAIRANYTLIDEFKKAILSNQKISPVRPEAKVQTRSIALGSFRQGEPRPFTIFVYNGGDGPLEIRAAGDCGCVNVERAAVAPAGRTVAIHGVIDSTELTGPYTRRVFLVMGDGDQPYAEIPITMSVINAYRLTGPTRNSVEVNSANGYVLDLNLKFAPGVSAKVENVALTGLRGTAKTTPTGPGSWNIHVQGKWEPNLGAKQFGAVAILTDNKQFRSIVYDYAAIKGILVEPSPLNLGDLGSEPRTFHVQLSRAGRRISVRSMTTEVPLLKMEKQTWKDGVLDVELSYSGKAPSGPYSDKLTFRTDDPSSPVVVLPFSATVK